MVIFLYGFLPLYYIIWFLCLLYILVSVNVIQLYLLRSTVYSISSFGHTMGCGVFHLVSEPKVTGFLKLFL